MSGIQYDQVVHAADSLLSRGERPTIRNVREILGQGSQTTLARFLNQWKEARTTQTPDPEISPELRRALTEEMRKREALARVGPEADLVSLRLDQEELLAENARLQESVRLLSEKAERDRVLSAELQLLKEEWTTAQNTLEGLRRELVRAELRLEGVPEQRQEIERLRVSLIESEKERAVLTERLGERKSPKTGP
ncbi:MAG: DNA-binding protein [Solirubrobacteraceae bacterium]